MDDFNDPLTEKQPPARDGEGTEPPSVPTRYCSKCATQVIPNKKGQCPACGVFTQGNQVARKHIANVARRDQLHAENIAEYQPDTLQLRRACRWLANISERLETVKDGTPEHQRLIEMWTKLSASLEASRTSRESRESADAARLSDDVLIERATEILRQLLDQRDEKRASEARLQTIRDQSTAAAEARVEEVTDAPTPTTTPEPHCPYCRQSRSRCAEIRETRIEAWRALHYSDPAEVERRNPRPTYSLKELYESNLGLLRPDAAFTPDTSPEPEDPTAEMIESLRRQRSGDPNVG